MGLNGKPLPSILTSKQGPRRDDDSIWRLVSEAHTPRAHDLSELHQLQKAHRERDEVAQAQRHASLSQTLRSGARAEGPRVMTREPKHIDYSATSPRSLEHSSSAFAKAMSDAGLRPVMVYHNLTTAELYEKALEHDQGTHVVSSGALATLSGAKTGRSPRDKRVVREPSTEGDIWWGEGSPNLEMDPRTFLLNRERAVDYLNIQSRIYVVDGYAGWDRQSRFKIRVVCARPYHALFVHNMLIRPSEEDLAGWGTPHFTIYNAGAFPANRFTSYMTSDTSIDISFEQREMVILGAQYAGEMRKVVFTIMNYWMPRRGILPLHCGCSMGSGGDLTLFLGLSGTGKTSLASDPCRHVLGDDQHCWGERGVFNVEGGCYVKCIGLNKEEDPLIWDAIRFGALLENVVFDEDSREVDFENSSITANTRACFPLSHVRGGRVPALGPHPRHVILLSCDVHGVLPAVSRLSSEQALYYFLSGYTARVAGGDVGVLEPEAVFSPCFGGAFLVWHPTKYAALLAERLQRHGTQAWLINTGWAGGSCRSGYRIPLHHTRSIVAAIHSGELPAAECTTMPVFGLQVPTRVAGVPEELLEPGRSWADSAQYEASLKVLAEMFIRNFNKYETGGGYIGPQLMQRILQAGPLL